MGRPRGQGFFGGVRGRYVGVRRQKWGVKGRFGGGWEKLEGTGANCGGLRSKCGVGERLGGQMGGYGQVLGGLGGKWGS